MSPFASHKEYVGVCKGCNEYSIVKKYLKKWQSGHNGIDILKDDGVPIEVAHDLSLDVWHKPKEQNREKRER